MKKIARQFIIGRRIFAKISAVEGIRLTKEMEKDFQTFEQQRLPHKDRRLSIVKKYAKAH